MWTPPPVAALAILATLFCLISVAALWIAGPVVGALVASAGGGTQVATGAVLALVTPVAAQWLYGRRWWTQPAALCLSTDRRFTPLPGDATIRVAIRRSNDEVAAAALENAAFWTVRVFERELDRRGFDAQIEGTIRYDIAPNEVQYLYDALNVADVVAFWPLECTFMPLGPTLRRAVVRPATTARKAAGPTYLVGLAVDTSGDSTLTCCGYRRQNRCLVLGR